MCQGPRHFLREEGTFSAGTGEGPESWDELVALPCALIKDGMWKSRPAQSWGAISGSLTLSQSSLLARQHLTEMHDTAPGCRRRRLDLRTAEAGTPQIRCQQLLLLE